MWLQAGLGPNYTFFVHLERSKISPKISHIGRDISGFGRPIYLGGYEIYRPYGRDLTKKERERNIGRDTGAIFVGPRDRTQHFFYPWREVC